MNRVTVRESLNLSLLNQAAGFQSTESEQAEPLAELRRLFWVNQLKRAYGPLFLKRNGRTILNNRFWAGWLCGFLSVFFDDNIGAFRPICAAGMEFPTLSSHDLADNVGTALLLAAKQAPSSFPTYEIRPVRIRQLIETMERMPRAESRWEEHQASL
jgi:hypothetical protein